MTPAALTPAAARRAPKRSAPAPTARHATAAPTRPRRVSGPARPPRPARPATAARPRPTTRSRPSAHRRALPTLRQGHLGAQLSALVRSLPTHRLLDRVVRGRAWIPILGLLLAGIVAMQVEILKLSAGTGRSLERVTALQSRNQQLRADVAVLGDDQRIERLAAQMGMVMPGPNQVRFLGDGASVSRALSSIHAPSASTFLASLPSAQTPAVASTSGASQTTVASAAPAAPTVSTPAPTASTPAPTVSTAAPTVSTPAAVPTGASATNTGVATNSGAATAASPSAVAPVTTAPSSGTTSSNGAAGVPTGG